MNENRLTLGKKIAKLRKNKGWNQDKLGKKIGVYGRRVSLYENDKSFPSIETLKKIAKVFDVSFDYLLGEYPKKHSEIKVKEISVNRLPEYIDYLTAEEKKVIIKIVEAFYIKNKIEKHIKNKDTKIF